MNEVRVAVHPSGQDHPSIRFDDLQSVPIRDARKSAILPPSRMRPSSMANQASSMTGILRISPPSNRPLGSVPNPTR